MWGTVSFLEGVRLVLASLGVIASAWGIAHARDGSLAFASPIRERIVSRRRWQMAGYLAIFLIFGVQTTLAAMVPDPAVVSLAGSAVTYAILAVLIDLLALTLMFGVGWLGVHEIVTRSLQPTQGEQLIESSEAGRTLAHTVNNLLSPITVALDILAESPALSDNERQLVANARSAADDLIEQTLRLQAEIRSLDPSWRSP